MAARPLPAGGANKSTSVCSSSSLCVPFPFTGAGSRVRAPIGRSITTFRTTLASRREKAICSSPCRPSGPSRGVRRSFRESTGRPTVKLNKISMRLAERQFRRPCGIGGMLRGKAEENTSTAPEKGNEKRAREREGASRVIDCVTRTLNCGPLLFRRPFSRFAFQFEQFHFECTD